MKFVIDCFIPVEDRVLDPASFEKFLHDRIKVNGKAGQLGDAVTIAREKVRVLDYVVASTVQFFSIEPRTRIAYVVLLLLL